MKICYFFQQNLLFSAFCAQSPHLCIVIEFCEKGPLLERLAVGNGISKNDFYRWGMQIADEMNYLQNKKVTARDLKPTQ